LNALNVELAPRNLRDEDLNSEAAEQITLRPAVEIAPGREDFYQCGGELGRDYSCLLKRAHVKEAHAASRRTRFLVVRPRVAFGRV
jgi:hypothetical protein